VGEGVIEVKNSTFSCKIVAFSMVWNKKFRSWKNKANKFIQTRKHGPGPSKQKNQNNFFSWRPRIIREFQTRNEIDSAHCIAKFEIVNFRICYNDLKSKPKLTRDSGCVIGDAGEGPFPHWGRWGREVDDWG